MKNALKGLAILFSVVFILQTPFVAHSEPAAYIKDSLPVSTSESVTAIGTNGSHVYVGRGSTIIVLDNTEGKLTQRGKQLKLPSPISDLAVEGKTLFAAAGNAGLYIIDIREPLNPVVRGVFRSIGYAEAITVVGTTAYLTDRSEGLQIIDVSNPVTPVLIGQACKGKNALRVAVRGSFAYAASEKEGLSIIDISEARVPKKVVSFYSADSVRNIAVSAQYACMAGNSKEIIIANISNPALPVYAGSIDAAGSVGDFALYGNYLYVADTDFGLSIYDITNAMEPKHISTFNYAGGKIDGLVVRDAKVYCFDSNDRVLSFDASNPANLKLLQCKNINQTTPVDVTTNTKPVNNANRKIAYITIDDGPSRRNTPKNLDTLKEYGIKATFFVLPKDKLDDIYKRILDEGHVIGNHTYSHDYKYLYGSTEDFRKDVLKAKDYIYKKLNYTTTIFRFPGGAMSRNKSIIKARADILNELGYTYFDWNSTTSDTAPNLKKYGSEESIVNLLANNVIKSTRGRKRLIVLIHDTADKTYTAKALPKIIEGLKEQGYIFDVLTNYKKASK